MTIRFRDKMGLFDKTISKTKTTFGSTSSKVGESNEIRKLESQIKDERNKVKETYEVIGKEYYRYTVDGDGSHEDTINKLVDQINESRKLIDDLEAQIKEVRQKAKEERETMKAEAEARQKEIEEAEEQKRLEKKRQEKENDDLF